MPTQQAPESPSPPASDESTSAPAAFKEIVASISWELHHSPRQWINALVATVVGLVLVINGKRCFDWLIVLTVGLISMIMAMNSISALWDVGFDSNLRVFVGVEVGLLGAYAAYRGKEGMDNVVGALLGFLLSTRLQSLLVSAGASWMSVETGMRWVIVIFYTIFMLGMMIMFDRDHHVKLLAIISPILGGAFVSSGVSFGVTELQLHGCFGGVLKGQLPDLAPVRGAWIEFLCQLWTSSAKDVGIFADSPYNPAKASSWTTDRICGCVFWAILAVIGLYFQLPANSCRRGRRTTARELEQGLLE